MGGPMPFKAKQTRKLTQRFAETSKFEAGVDQMIYDTEVSGFALRVLPSGHRAWMLRDHNSKFSLGSITELNEHDARIKAIEIKQGFRSGRDPIREAKDAAAAIRSTKARATITAGYAFQKFVDWPDAYRGCTDDYRQSQIKILREHVLTHSKIMHLPLPDIGYTEIQTFVASVPKNQWASTNKLLNAIAQAYKFFRKDLDEIVPAFGHLATPSFEDLRAGTREKYDRLQPEQLRAVYDAAERMAEQNVWHSGFFRMAILSARRTGTIRAMRWDDLILNPNDGPAYWRIPAKFNKKGRGGGNGRPQSLPLTPRMITIINEMPRQGEYVFGGDKIAVAQGSKVLKKIRDWSGIETDRDGNVWTLHGIRRSMASSRLGAEHKFLVDFIAGRRPNSASDPNYFQGDYLEEQLKVLLLWDAIIFPSTMSGTTSSCSNAAAHAPADRAC